MIIASTNEQRTTCAGCGAELQIGEAVVLWFPRYYNDRPGLQSPPLGPCCVSWAAMEMQKKAIGRQWSIVADIWEKSHTAEEYGQRMIEEALKRAAALVDGSDL